MNKKTTLFLFCVQLFVSAIAFSKTNSPSPLATGNLYFVDTNATGLNDGTSWADAYTNLQTAIANAVPAGQIWVAQGTYFPSTIPDNFASFQLKNGIKIFGGFLGNEVSVFQRNPALYVTTLSGDLDHSGSFTGGDAFHVVISYNEDSTAVIDGFTITGGNASGGNVWDMSGGAVSCQPNGGGYHNPVIQNCLLTNNTAVVGGAIGVVNWNVGGCNAAPTFLNCIICSNTSQGVWGATYIECQGNGSYCSAHFENDLFYGNSGGGGGSGAALGSEHANGGRCDVVVTGCTFSNNVPAGGATIGYRTYGGPGSFTINNSIFYSEPLYTDAFFSGNNNDMPGPGSVSGGGNIYLDPGFVNPALNDFHLKCTSPCREGGNNSFAIDPNDLGGNPRISGTYADMGAYETNFPPPPSVSGTASASPVCQNDLVTLTGSGASSYAWDNGVTDGVPFAATGTATYNVTGTDANGCVATSTVLVNVNPLPAVTTSPGAAVSVCVNQPLTIHASGAVTYSWSPASGLNTTTADTAVAAVSSNITYTISGTDINGCVGTATIDINSISPPVLDAGSDQSICPGGSTVLNASLTAFTGIPVFNWTTAYAISDPSVSNPVVSPAVDTAYALNATDDSGCIAYDTVRIFIYALPVPPLVSISPNDSICAGQTITYNMNGAGGAGPFTYYFVHGGPMSSGPDSTFSNAPPATEVDSLWVTDQHGCASSASIFNIFVDSNKDIGGHVTYSGGDLFNATVYLIFQGSSSAAYDTLGTNFTDAGGIYSFTSVNAGNYYVKIIPSGGFPDLIDSYFGNVYLWDSAQVVTHGCISNTNSTDITMVEITPPAGPGSISGTVYEGIGFGQRLIGGQLVPYTNVIPGVPVKVGKNPSGTIVAQGTTDAGGNYNFTNLPYDDYKIYTDIPGYPMDSSYSVTLTSGNPSSGNLDYFVDSNSVYIDLTTTVHQNNPASTEINLFPNPSSGKIFLKMNKEVSDCSVNIYDAVGKIVYSKKYPAVSGKENVNEIDPGELPAGIYSVSIFNGNGIRTVKLIISR